MWLAHKTILVTDIDLIMGWPFVVLAISAASLGQRPDSLDQGLTQKLECGDLRLLI